MQHVQATPKSLKELRPDLPDGLVEIVHRLLAKAPDDRFPSRIRAFRRSTNCPG